MESFAAVVASARPILLDGGLATQLEARGHRLGDALWSARLLLAEPQEVRAAHEDFFAAGAEVAISASYQVSELGFAAAGRDRGAVETALRRSITVAREAADSAVTGEGATTAGLHHRWVAASVGPYGAALADGSEYRGNYGLTVQELRAWHRPRLETLAEAGADVLALETIPCLAEVEALLAEVERLGVPAWLSLTVAAPKERSAAGIEAGAGSLPTTRLGEPLSQAYAMAGDVASVVAVGANCFDPDLVGGVATAARPFGKAILAYPNSGELWDASTRRWFGGRRISGGAARAWVEAGVQLIGGCCRVGPSIIASMRRAI